MNDLGDRAGLRLLAVLAACRHDGTVLLSPAWHQWRDGGFRVVTGSRDVKAAHLRRDPKAGIAVCEYSPPCWAAAPGCRARLLTARAVGAVKRIASRYLGLRAGLPMPGEPAMTSSSASNPVIYVPGTSPASWPEALCARREGDGPETGLQLEGPVRYCPAGCGRPGITRSPDPHAGFGAVGPHVCLDSHLTRREMTVTLRELLAPASGIVAGGPGRLLSSFSERRQARAVPVVTRRGSGPGPPGRAARRASPGPASRWASGAGR